MKRSEAARRDARRNPSADEVRLRSELDRARRELVKLKRGGAPAAPAGELANLRQQVAELAETKQRLSRLYFTQVEENRKRASKLHQILENIGEINAGLDHATLLARLAESIRGTLGFRTVLVRVRTPGTDTLAACAFAGLDEAARTRLAEGPLSVAEFQSWRREDARVSRSYYLSHDSGLGEALPARGPFEPGPREEWEWHPGDVLVTPLESRGGDLLACFVVGDPADRLVPSTETVEMLEIFGQHAVVAIENARVYAQVEGHARELEDAGRLTREAHTLKANFVATVSHELRTPLAAIRAHVETLLGLPEAELTPARLTSCLKVVGEESTRLQRLIESILDLNALDFGARRRARKGVDLAEVAFEIVRVLGPAARAGGVQVKVAVEAADTRLTADPDQMRQLALHLGGNAVKFTPSGGAVTFVLKGDARDLVLCVEDTGVGIPPQALGRVFERFYQVEGSGERRPGGVGLGLAICKSIVDSHGGRISVESAPGKGARFTVTLPRGSGARVVVRPQPTRQPAQEEVLRMAVEMVADVLSARVVSILSLEPEGDLVVQAAIGLEAEIVRDIRIRRGSGVAGWVAEHRHPVCVVRPEERSEVTGSGRPSYESGTFLSVPLEGTEGPLGVLNVTDPCSHGPFRAEECHLLLHLAERVGAAWESARLTDRTGRDASTEVGQDAALDLRRALARVGENPAGEARAQLARSLARALSLTESEIGAISYAASQETPAGNGAAPDPAAPGAPAAESFSLVRDVVLSHHEWWDGSGFPRGLQGREIPVGGRILAVVDAYERMTVGRPNRPARPPEEALEQIRKLKGRQFDPEIVEAFEALKPGLATGRKELEPALRDSASATQGGE